MVSGLLTRRGADARRRRPSAPAAQARRGRRRAARSARPGMLLGAVHDYDGAHDVTVPLAPGDTLLLYTDGVTDTPGRVRALRRGAAHGGGRRRARGPARRCCGPSRARSTASRAAPRSTTGRCSRCGAPHDGGLPLAAARRRERRPRRAGHRRRHRDRPRDGARAGRRAARAWSSAGAAPAPLEATVAAIEAAGGEALAVPADVREPDAVAQVVDAALARFGALDVLVNNAGGQFSAPAEEIAGKGWRAVQRVTVDAVWEVTRDRRDARDDPRRRRADRVRRVQPAARQPGLRARRGRPRRRREPRLRARARVEPRTASGRSASRRGRSARRASTGTARTRSPAGRAASRSAASARPRRSAR